MTPSVTRDAKVRSLVCTCNTWINWGSAPRPSFRKRTLSLPHTQPAALTSPTETANSRSSWEPTQRLLMVSSCNSTALKQSSATMRLCHTQCPAACPESATFLRRAKPQTRQSSSAPQ
eukprot:4432010-Amphidinium_carterae.2